MSAADWLASDAVTESRRPWSEIEKEARAAGYSEDEIMTAFESWSAFIYGVIVNANPLVAGCPAAGVTTTGPTAGAVTLGRTPMIALLAVDQVVTESGSPATVTLPAAPI